MTAIIAVLDEKGVHIGTDGRACCNRRKTDGFVKCKILNNGIIFACAGDADTIYIVERFYNNKGLYDIEDETLFELKEYIDKYNDSEYGIIFSDGNIIKLLEKKYLKHEYEYIRSGTGGLQALSAYNALKNNLDRYYKNKGELVQLSKEVLIRDAIKIAIDMDENCGGTPKYYFLKKPDGQ